MTPRELMEHELAFYKKIARLKLLGHWSRKLAGKRLTVVVYRVTPLKPLKVGNYHYNQRIKNRLAVSYGERILASVILE